MPRLFTGLEIPDDQRGDLARLRQPLPGSSRWTEPDNLHITLRFFGDVDSRMAEDVATALSAIRADLPPLRIQGCGVFDSKGHPNAVWAGVAPRDPLAAPHRKIDRAMVRIGLEPEHRAYLPHVTLARLARSAGPVDAFIGRHAALTSPAFTVTHMTLYESRLGTGGASYEPITRYPLTGP